MGATTSGQRDSSRQRHAQGDGAPGTSACSRVVTPPHLPSGRYGGQPVDLDLVDTLRSTGAARQFHPDPVPDDVLARLLDTARFAPSGGNRQGWRVIVVKDPVARAGLRDLYLSGWYEYLAMVTAGLVPWAPVTDREAEAVAVANAAQFADAGAAAPGLRRDPRDGTRPAAGPRRPVRSGRGRPRPVPLHLRRRRVHLPVRVEPAPGRPLRRPRRRHDDHAGTFARTTCAPSSASPTPLRWRPWWPSGDPVAAPRRLTRAPVASFAWVDRYDGDPLTGS